MAAKLFRRLLSYFFNGILIAVPLSITGYILYKMFIFLDELLPFEKEVPGIGLLALFVFLIIIGLIGTSLIAIPVRSWFKSLLERAPLINTIYSAVNDLVSAFVGQKRKFTKPVLVTMDRELGLERLGFITDEGLHGLHLSEGKVAVYIPMSYAFSGNLWVIPNAHVRPLQVPAGDVMKYIISGGVSEPDSKS